MAHGAETGINLVLGSAGCQPAVRGSLPRTDFDPEVTRGKNEHSAQRPIATGEQPALPRTIAPIVNCEPFPARNKIRSKNRNTIRFQSCTPSITAMGTFFAKNSMSPWRPRDLARPSIYIARARFSITTVDWMNRWRDLTI
jgi:hypothetical protein